MLAKLRPDMVLLDVLLPEMDGIATACRLAELDRPPAVVLISSRSVGEFGERLAVAPVHGFLGKDEITGDRLWMLAGLLP